MEKNYKELYEQAIERAKQINNTPYTAHWDVMKEVIDELFPELKESEDEKIRKSLINMLKNDEKCYLKEIEWLEKQGDHAKFRNSIQVGDKVTRNEDDMLVNLSQLNRVAKKNEKQGLQKPAEPTLDIEIPFGAKDSELIGESITIPDGCYAVIEGNKVVIRKGEKPAEWSEKHIANVFEKVGLAKIAREQGNDALTEALQSAMIELAKYSVLLQPKQEWSEEYELEIEVCAREAEDNNCIILAKHIRNLKKSLRPQNRWKPSDEQIEALETTLYTNMSKNDERYSILSDFVTELKKLKS